MSFKISIALAVVMNFSVAVAPVSAGTLTVPDELTLLFLNGEKVPTRFFSHTNKIDIAGGPNNIILKYDDVVSGDISDDHTVFESLPFALNFVAQAQYDYQVNMTLPRNEEEAKIFATKPIVTLSDSKNSLVALEIEYQRSEQEEKLAALFESERKVPGAFAKPVLTPESTYAVKTESLGNKPSTLQDQNEHEVVQPQALAMLQYWWQQASSSQRLEFKKSVEKEQ